MILLLMLFIIYVVSHYVVLLLLVYEYLLWSHVFAIICSSVGYFYVCFILFFFFCFKHNTAYEMRISDWSSDVCSSDLSAGWHQIANWITQDINAGRTVSSVQLPEWATRGSVWEAQGVHTAAGSWNPRQKRFEGRSILPVYERQVGAPRLVGETPSLETNVVYEDDAVRCWTLPAPHPRDVLLLSFKTKMHTLSPQVVQGIVHAVGLAEASYKALVIGQLDEPFSAGADLKAMLPAFAQGGAAAVEPIEREMQDMVMRLRYAQVPVVAALAGMALGGGCELSVHCATRVAHFETYIGFDWKSFVWGK